MTLWFRNVSQNSSEQYPVPSMAPGQRDCCGQEPLPAQTFPFSLLGHIEVLSLPWALYVPSICALQLLIWNLFITGPVLAWRKAAKRQKVAKGLHVCCVNENTWVTLTVVIRLFFSFLSERFTFFKLTYNRSHNFYSGDSKPSFHVKLLFVRRRRLIILSWSYFCKKSQRQWTWQKLWKLS